VLPCRLVAQLVEFPDELLVDVAHLLVWDLIGVEIDFGELPDDLIQKIGIGKSVNLVVESEFLEDLLRLLVILVDVVLEVFCDIVGVVTQDSKVYSLVLYTCASAAFFNEGATFSIPCS